MSEQAAEVLSIGGREVRVTHPDKAYFSRQTKLSKLDLVRYYLSVAPGALAGIQDRPLVLKRYVNGADGDAFYQKRAPTERPPWLRTVALSFPSGRTAEEVVVDDAAGLAWIVNLGCIELHPHPTRSGDLEHPDELRIDLDPGPENERAILNSSESARRHRQVVANEIEFRELRLPRKVWLVGVRYPNLASPDRENFGRLFAHANRLHLF